MSDATPSVAGAVIEAGELADVKPTGKRVLIVASLTRPAGRGGMSFCTTHTPVCLVDESIAADVVAGLMATNTHAKNPKATQVYSISPVPAYDDIKSFQEREVQQAKSVEAKLTPQQIAVLKKAWGVIDRPIELIQESVAAPASEAVKVDSEPVLTDAELAAPVGAGQ